MRESTIKRSLHTILLVTAVASTRHVFAQDLTAALAQAALREAVSKHNARLKTQDERQNTTNPESIVVNKILGCVPAYGKGEDIFICPLEAINDRSDGKYSIVPVAFRKTKDAWQAIPENNYSPACAPIDVAQENLRKIRSSSSIKIKSEVDNGEGSFSDQRGISRDQKGSYRIMCRYEGTQDLLGTNEERLFISYLWYENGKYVFDKDVELWD